MNNDVINVKSKDCWEEWMEECKERSDRAERHALKTVYKLKHGIELYFDTDVRIEDRNKEIKKSYEENIKNFNDIEYMLFLESLSKRNFKRRKIIEYWYNMMLDDERICEVTKQSVYVHLYESVCEKTAAMINYEKRNTVYCLES